MTAIGLAQSTPSTIPSGTWVWSDCCIIPDIWDDGFSPGHEVNSEVHWIIEALSEIEIPLQEWPQIVKGLGGYPCCAGMWGQMAALAIHKWLTSSSSCPHRWILLSLSTVSIVTVVALEATSPDENRRGRLNTGWCIGPRHGGDHTSGTVCHPWATFEIWAMLSFLNLLQVR